MQKIERRTRPRRHNMLLGNVLKRDPSHQRPLMQEGSVARTGCGYAGRTPQPVRSKQTVRMVQVLGSRSILRLPPTAYCLPPTVHYSPPSPYSTPRLAGAASNCPRRNPAAIETFTSFARPFRYGEAYESRSRAAAISSSASSPRHCESCRRFSLDV